MGQANQETIAALLSPFGGGIVSGDRADVFQLWRIEGPDVV